MNRTLGARLPKNPVLAIPLATIAVLLFGGSLLSATAHAQQARPSATGSQELERIGKPVRGVPVSQAVKVGGFLFVSGTPAFDDKGKLAVGDFPTQMKQVMENLTAELKSAGTGWDRVVKTNVLLTRREDFAEMNRIYAAYFPDGKFPARTTSIVAGLPHPDFLLEIDCEAALK